MWSDGPSHPLSCQMCEIGGCISPGFWNLCVCSGSGAAAVMERGIAAALTCRRADSAGLQTLLLLALLDQAGPVGIHQEMGYGGKIQLVIVITK